METKTEKEIAILFGMSLNGEDGTVSLKELERLAETANVEVVGTLFQRAKEITPASHSLSQIHWKRWVKRHG